ncbi:glycine betaine ABC transporter substrate-binding protein [Sediminitomix flava]|uniref:Glycine betaine/proline transport system substrate-binding protein n=1 Tax=Sediminitomix flava TaxID=379075 RepID=A0A315Z9S4_SEDFL|nr:glycine betaine ABC transporter substrate-binding protein [Sediminitomix flava]PWJ41813.1 glycine betaine/proline transport system substrate-binding protein [Sediminitomix flava]
MNTINLGQIDLSFHWASAGVYVNLLKYFGYKVNVSSAPHEAMFNKFKSGEVEILLSAWLPGSHSKYLEGFDDYDKLSVIYRPYCIWGVPEYVPTSFIRKIEDLSQAEIGNKFNKLIQGINPGAGISRFSLEIVAHFQLDQLGFHFANGSLDDCIQAFKNAVEKQEYVVIPLWHPQYIHHDYRIRALEDPENFLRGEDEATTILRKDSVLNENKELISVLQKIDLGNDVISEIDFYINIEGLDAEKASLKWIEEKFGGIESYVSHLKS